MSNACSQSMLVNLWHIQGLPVITRSSAIAEGPCDTQRFQTAKVAFKVIANDAI